MKNNDFISALIRVITCLVLAFSIASFPPSAAHAGPGKDMGALVHSGDIKSATGHHVLPDNETARSGSLKKCGSQTNSAHSEAGPSQCCTGICLSAVLIEGPSVRLGHMSASEFIVGATQMTHIDPTGFLRPPRLLI